MSLRNISKRAVTQRRLALVLAPLLLAIVLVAIAIAAASLLGVADSFFLGALIATLAGVVAGIPFALAIDRWGQERARSEATLALAKRKRSVIGLLHDELDENLRRLVDPSELGKRPRPQLTYVPLLTSTWHALRASGDLQLDDADLLGQLAEAYEAIEALNRLDNLALEYAYGAAAAFKGAAAGPQFEALQERITSVQDEYLLVVEKAVAMASRAFDLANDAIPASERSPKNGSAA